MRFAFRLHPAGAALFAGAFLFLPSTKVLSALLALVWHETCHVLAMLGCGLKHCSIELTPFGGMADAREYEALSPMKQAVCAFAGVAGSGISVVLLVRCLPDTAFVHDLAQANFSLAFFNCLPVWPLDGARTCVAAAAFLGREKDMRKILSILSVLTGASMTGLALLGAWKGIMNPSLLFAGPYLCYAAIQGYVCEQMRGMCFAGSKLDGRKIMPVRMYAGAPGMKDSFAGMLGRFSRERYHLIAEVGDSGLRKIWTEEEMLQSLLKSESIGRSCK